MWFDDDNLRACYCLGIYEEQLQQIKRLINEPGNESMIYTRELCRILNIEIPKRETGAETEPDTDLPI